MMPLAGIVKHLLIINVVVFIAVQLLPPEWGNMLPFLFSGYRVVSTIPIITYMFTHADISHILFNMLSLYFYGSDGGNDAWA